MELPSFLKEFTKSFRKNDILSVDIGFTNIKVVHARKKQNSLRILNYGIERTPSGCIRNGIISDLEGIAENLKNVVANRGMNEKNVKIVISAGSNIISKVIYIPKGDGKLLESRIREEISGQMPVDINSQRLFYRIIEENEESVEGCFKILVTIVPNTVIDNYMRLMRMLEFNPVAIEIPFSSVARFFSKGIVIADRSGKYAGGRALKLDTGATAVIDLGSETTNLSILNNGALEFNRVVLAGGRNLDEVIAKRLGIKKDRAKIFKEMHGISENLKMGDDIQKVVDECLREYLGEILRNIKRSLSFYIERCGGQKIERMFFIGGGSGLKGLCAFAEEIMEMPVYTVDMMEFDNVEFESFLNKDKIRYLVNVLGIAM